MGYRAHTLFAFCFLGLTQANSELTTYERLAYGECDWARNPADVQPFEAAVCECSHFLDSEEYSTVSNREIDGKDAYCQRKGTSGKNCRFILSSGKRDCMIEMIVKEFQYEVGEDGVDIFLGESEAREEVLAEVACPTPPNGCTIENLGETIVPATDKRRRRLNGRSRHERKIAWRRRRLQNTIYTLENGKELQMYMEGERCWNLNLIYSETIDDPEECAEMAQILDPPAAYFSWRTDRLKCEIPNPSNAVEDCSTLAILDVPLWSIYVITDAVECTGSNDCEATEFCWGGKCEDTSDSTVCETYSDVPTDDGWTWSCDWLYDLSSFMCDKPICETLTTDDETTAEPVSCAETADCPFGESMFCNFDDGLVGGNCEYCRDIQNGCANEEFINSENGFEECIEVCEDDSSFTPAVSPTTAMPSEEQCCESFQDSEGNCMESCPGECPLSMTEGGCEVCDCDRKVIIFERLAVRVKASNLTYVNEILDEPEFATQWNEALTDADLGVGGIEGYEVKTDGDGVGTQNPCYYYPVELCNGSLTNTDALENHKACRNYINETSMEDTDNCLVGEYCPNHMNSSGTEPCEVCPESLAECDQEEDYAQEYCRKCGEQEIYDRPRDLNKMIRIMADDRGGTFSKEDRFNGMKKRIRHALQNNAMLDGEDMFYKQQWRKMQALTIGDNSNYNKNNFNKLGIYLDGLVTQWEIKYGKRYTQVEDSSTEE